MAEMPNEETKAGDSFFKLAKQSTEALGFWPLAEHSSRTRKFFYKLFGRFNMVMSYLTTLQYILFILELLLNKDLEAAFERIQFSLACTLVSSKLTFLGQKPVASMIREAIQWGNVNTKEYNLYAQSTIDYCRNLGIVTIVINIAASIGYVLMTQINVARLGLSEAGRLLIISWYPLDTEKYAFQIIWLDAIRATHMCIQNACTYICFNTIMIDCVAKLKACNDAIWMIKQVSAVMGNKFATFHMDDQSGLRDEQAAYERLSELVKEHQNLIGYVTRLNDSVQYFLMVEYNITSVLVATDLFQIIQRNNLIFYIPALAIIICQLLILCWNANEILVQSLNIGDGLYNSSWYLYNKNTRQAVQRVIIETQRPLSLTNGPLGPLRADSGVEVLKLAYSFMSIISATRS